MTTRTSKGLLSKGLNRRSFNLRGATRRACFESLESRNLLSITLPSLANVTLPAGTAIYVPLNGTDPGSTLNYSVTASDGSKLTTVMMPKTNKVLEFKVNIDGVDQVMDFQLFDNLAPETTAHIEELVESGFYNGLKIYRNQSGFVIQGGNNPPTGAIKTNTSLPIAEEFDPNLQYNTAGILAMARTSTPGTSSTEFFVTLGAARSSLDYNYTMFGIQTSGTATLNAIAAKPSETSSGYGYLVTPLTITSASIITTSQTGVLQLRAPDGVTGPVTVTVTASDGTNTPATQSFTVTIQADSASNRANPFDSVTPTTPTSVTFLPPTGSSSQITNFDNSDSSHTLQFQVSGVTSGNVVEILADGNVIGEATANGTSVIVTTSGSFKLTNGAHTFTAIQIAKDKTVSVTESGSSTAINKTADVPSLSSSAVQLTLDTVAPVLNFTPITTGVAGVAYTCQVAATDTDAALTYSLVTPVTGLSIDPTTGLISWTPTDAQVSTTDVTVKVADTAGNAAQQTYSVTVLAANHAPVLTAKAPSLGTTNEDTRVAITVASLINGGSGSTQVTDEDDGAVPGDIALTGVSGGGTWEYSVNGTDFSAVGTVSESSALLLPATAVLRYTPTDAGAETATIKYHAWDKTASSAGLRVSLSGSGATGGATAYSVDTDTASLAVTAVNDAPVLSSKSPSIGTTNYKTASVISLASFINTTSGTGITDADSGRVLGGIAITALTGSGTWAYSTDGTTFTNIGTVSIASALLLPSTAKLRYTPVDGTVETATITYRAWDTTSGTSTERADTTTNGGTTAFSTATDTASLAVTVPNVAPVLTATNPSLGSTTPTAAVTISLTSFINNASGTQITDGNTGDVVGGIALTGVTGSGTWSYSVDGTTFTDVGTVSGSSALLLPKTAKLRYTPNGSSTGTATIVYRAWDGSAGSSGGRGDTTTNGGVTPFSTTSDTAVLAVASGSVAGYVYVDADNDGLRVTPSGPHLGIAGAVVTLYLKNSSGWTEVDRTMTGSDGSYRFTGLAAGTYRVAETQPTSYNDGKETLGTVGGTAAGTADDNLFSGIVLGAGDNATGYNFGEWGLKPSQMSMTFFLASSRGVYVVTQTDAAPVVSLANASTTYTTGGAKVAVAPKATIVDTDSAMLASVSLTLSNRLNGAAESLAAATSGTSIVAAYSDGVLALSGVASVAEYQTVLRTVTYCNSGVLLSAGQRTVTVTANDGITNSQAATTTITVGDAATVYSISADNGTIGTGNVSSFSFSFANAAVGATYNYTISSSGGSATLTGTGTITSATQKVSGIDLSSLPDGALTIKATLTDSAGHTGVAATTTATLDRTKPTGYTVAANSSVYGDVTASSLGFTISGAEVDATYNYIISTSGGTLTASGSGKITSATQQITGINGSGLSAGTLTISVMLTDVAGNVGAATVATTVLDRTFPTGYSIAANDAAINNTEASSTGFTIAGAEVGTTYNYTITSSGGGTAVTGSGPITSATQQVTNIDISRLSSGSLTFNVTLTDAAGNKGNAASAAATLDRTAPSGYTITANDAAINNTEASSTGFTIAGAEVGTTYNYSITSNGGGDPVTGSGTITSATQQVTGIDVSQLSNGTLAISVKLTDAAGNMGNAATATTTLDRTPPTDYTISASDAAINSTEAASTGFTIADAEVGAAFTYTITSSGGGAAVTGTGTITSATQQVTKDVSTLADGTLTISVTLTDTVGNTGDAAIATTVLDRTVPANFTMTADANTYDASTATAFGFAFGGAEVGATYSVTITSSGGGSETITRSGTIASATEHLSGIDISSLTDGTLTISATLTDLAGNHVTITTDVATLART
jgi:cyclophilin family peptidyl-prolyl cis-trans isomerase